MVEPNLAVHFILPGPPELFVVVNEYFSEYSPYPDEFAPLTLQ